MDGGLRGRPQRASRGPWHRRHTPAGGALTARAAPALLQVWSDAVTTDSYLRYPHISGDGIVFVAENDVWLIGSEGGRAYRVSADHAPARSPRLSPDGSLVAWSVDRDGAFEVYVAPADGGVSRRLTYWGQQGSSGAGAGCPTRSSSWSAPRGTRSGIGRSPTRIPRRWAPRAAGCRTAGSTTSRSALTAAILLSTATTVEPAWWKRYRGVAPPPGSGFDLAW